MIKKIEIAPMEKRHIDYLVEIEKECFSTPWSYQSLIDELSNKSAKFFVAEDENTVYGYIGMHVILDEAYINNIAVSPPFQGIKIGTALLEHAINFAKNSSLSFISLEVRKSNYRAINLYKSKGFKDVGRRANFYRFPQEDAIIMTYYV